MLPLLKLTLRRLCLSSIDFIYLLNVAPTQIWPHTERERQTVDDSASKANVAASLSLQLTLSVFPDICSLSAQVWCLLAHLKYVCCLITNISSAATVRKTDKQGGVWRFLCFPSFDFKFAVLCSQYLLNICSTSLENRQTGVGFHNCAPIWPHVCIISFILLFCLISLLTFPQ